jgi:hypothetical protein
MLHALAPWAILGALGLRELRALAPQWPRWVTHPATNAIGYGAVAALVVTIFSHKLPGPTWLPFALVAAVAIGTGLFAWSMLDRVGIRAGAITFAILFVCYTSGHFYAAEHIDSNRYDVAFMKSVRQRVETERLPIVIDMSANSFHGMMGLFYMPDDAVLVHNLTFLGAAEISAPEVFIVAMESLKEDLNNWGTVEALETSKRIPRARTSKDKLTLFRLRFDEKIVRVPAHNIRVTPMQAMNRVAGPFLAPQVANQEIGRAAN